MFFVPGFRARVCSTETRPMLSFQRGVLAQATAGYNGTVLWRRQPYSGTFRWSCLSSMAVVATVTGDQS